MSHDTYKELMMGYLDGELTELEAQRMEQHLEGCAECREELGSFRKLKEMTQPMKLAMPDDAYWERYWSSVYNRLERRVGWILLSIGLIAVTSYYVYQLVARLVLDPGVAMPVRFGVAALIIGLCTLFVSVLRERIVLLRSDKYKRIRR
jgi:predicted anti-sigma-YlaC factor YlaD